VPQVYSLLELLRIERPPAGCGEHSVDRASGRYAACSNLESHFVGRTQADPACAARALSGTPSSRCRRMEPFP